MKKELILLLSLLTITGCIGFHPIEIPQSTSPITEQSGESVQNWRIYQGDLTSPSPIRTVKVSFLRDSGMLASACRFNIMIDGQAAFAVAASQYQTLYLEPGKHLIELEVEDPHHCQDLTALHNTLLREGEDKAYRISVVIEPNNGLKPLIIEVTNKSSTPDSGHSAARTR